MNKKIFLCITLLTHISTYTMLTSGKRAMRTRQLRRMYYNNSQNSHACNTISNHLIICNPDVALEKTAAIIFSSLQHTQEEKISYIKSALSRTDIPTEHYTALLLLKTFFNQQKLYAQEPLIHMAIKENNQPLLKVALDYGLKNSVNVPNESGHSALYLTASQGNLPLAQTLIAYSANLNIQNNQGQTPLHAIVTSPLINTTPENNFSLIQTMRCITNAGADTRTLDNNNNKKPIDYVHESFKEFENYRPRTLHNEFGELMCVYHEMEKMLHTPSNNE